jgi:hypothetical protein
MGPFTLIQNSTQNQAMAMKAWSNAAHAGRVGNVSYQPQGGEHVVIVSHEVHLPDGSQRLLLCQLPWTLRQVEPLAPHTDSAAGNNDHIEA